ncbi:DODA-type extradiol aromatic ring-opening family dioxygenase [Sedimenticola sp.]|uniref:DODA-type extradiol aromatic ring-opening family dioxygenase n=1 Tax=Sedimenticola sp. TaxID=1940285 RepID=UPI002589772D|nr:class III extradiol ring-cleavage dioxygenase [Sedimenticola sp.]MCW8902378.1 dioxygenase [Sedimenticola sp.]
MMPHYPTLFISHGAPDFILTEQEAVAALREIGERFPQPRAIVVISAHWTRHPLGITAGTAHQTIHDFGGFPEALYQLAYPAKGDPELATSIADSLTTHGFDTELISDRGLDHGVWIPLMLSYPHADIPVVQVSLPSSELKECARLGKALMPLREHGMLIIGSGGSVHNLGAMNREGHTDVWASGFESWLQKAVEGNRFDDLLTAEQATPLFRTAHPTLEHFAPLVTAWAAGDQTRPGKRLHHSFTYGNIGMSMFEFH